MAYDVIASFPQASCIFWQLWGRTWRSCSHATETKHSGSGLVVSSTEGKHGNDRWRHDTDFTTFGTPSKYFGSAIKLYRRAPFEIVCTDACRMWDAFSGCAMAFEAPGYNLWQLAQVPPSFAFEREKICPLTRYDVYHFIPARKVSTGSLGKDDRLIVQLYRVQVFPPLYIALPSEWRAPAIIESLLQPLKAKATNIRLDAVIKAHLVEQHNRCGTLMGFCLVQRRATISFFVRDSCMAKMVVSDIHSRVPLVTLPRVSLTLEYITYRAADFTRGLPLNSAADMSVYFSS